MIGVGIEVFPRQGEDPLRPRLRSAQRPPSVYSMHSAGYEPNSRIDFSHRLSELPAHPAVALDILGPTLSPGGDLISQRPVFYTVGLAVAWVT